MITMYNRLNDSWVWLYCIVTNKLFEDKQEKIDAFQIEINSQNLELMTREK